MTMITDRIAKAGRIVIKIGSALLFDPAKGEARKDWMRALAEDVAKDTRPSAHLWHFRPE